MPDQSTLYQVGQSLVAKVTQVDQEKKRFLLSLRRTDCYDGEPDSSIELLATYLTDRRRVIRACQSSPGEHSKGCWEDCDKSSLGNFWPILCCIQRNRLFIKIVCLYSHLMLENVKVSALQILLRIFVYCIHI